jgi:hypothetical protein
MSYELMVYGYISELIRYDPILFSRNHDSVLQMFLLQHQKIGHPPLKHHQPMFSLKMRQQVTPYKSKGRIIVSVSKIFRQGDKAS